MDFPLHADLPGSGDGRTANHLRGMPLPQVSVGSTSEKMAILASLGAARTVVCGYPTTGLAPQSPNSRLKLDR
jgi:hypothetical protein